MKHTSTSFIPSSILLWCLAFILIVYNHEAIYAKNALKNVHYDTPLPKIDPSSEIVFGQTGMLSGHFSHYAQHINQGILSCFDKVNTNGGIHGKKLRLISLDDFGSPETAYKNIMSLKKAGIDMFLGNMGTRGILQSLPLIEKKEIAVFFPWGGDNQLRSPSLTHIINGLGFLDPQVYKIAEYLTSNLDITKIAIFHADDTFSVEAKDALVKYLEERNVKPVAIAAYNRQTLDITIPARRLLKYDPKAIVCIATSTPTVKLVNYFFEKGHFGTTFLGIDSTFFARDILAAKGVPFFFSSAVPDPFSKDFNLTTQFQNDLRGQKLHSFASSLSFAYYISAQILVRALQKITPPLTKEKIIDAIENMDHENLGGIDITFNPHNRHAFGGSITMIKG